MLTKDTDLGWEIYPLGLHNSLLEIWKKYNKPILITENGIPDKSDRLRAPFIISHLRQVRRAIFEGVDVKGYLYWSLFDSYEWHQGYSDDSRFGLFKVGKGNEDKEQIVTSGAVALRSIIRESPQEEKEHISKVAHR